MPDWDKITAQVAQLFEGLGVKLDRIKMHRLPAIERKSPTQTDAEFLAIKVTCFIQEQMYKRDLPK